MPNSLPDSSELLHASVQYLEQQLLPKLASDDRFLTRVAINALHIALREQRLGASHAAAELARLTQLLGRAGSLEELNDLLVERIRSGAIGWDDDALRSHVRQSLAENLAVNNPKWLNR